MVLLSSVSKRIFLITICFFSVLLGGIGWCFSQLIPFFSETSPLAVIAPYGQCIPFGFAGAGFILAVFLWFFIRALIASPIRTAMATRSAAPAKKTVDPKLAQARNQRYFLHILTALQNDGRLLDFFSENLDQYEDDQIGAAVRTIHDNSRRSLQKYVKMAPVMEEEEGSEVTIPEGFNPNEVKLTGNVTGKPPFSGIVRHKGWKAEEIRMPKFNDTEGSDILAAAEIEIL